MSGCVIYTGINMRIQMYFLYTCICIRAVIAEIVPCALGCAVSAFHGLCSPMYDSPVMASDSVENLEAVMRRTGVSNSTGKSMQVSRYMCRGDVFFTQH